MKDTTIAAIVSENEATHKVYGSVFAKGKLPLYGATVKVYDKTMRSKKLLGETLSSGDGSYSIGFTLKNDTTAALLLEVYDGKKELLKTSETIYQIPKELQVDFEVDIEPTLEVNFSYEQLMSSLAPFAADVPLATMTETANDSVIDFVAQKTGIPQLTISRLAMAVRFESFSSIKAHVWYGILSQGIVNPNATGQRAENNFENAVNSTYDALMHTPVTILADALQKAVDSRAINAIDLDKIIKALSAQQLTYAVEHPVTKQPSALYQKAALAGLNGKDIEAFIKAKNSHTGNEDEFWDGLKKDKIAEALQAVFKVAQLTGNCHPITDSLVKKHHIKTRADIKKLAGYSRQDWAEMLSENKAALADIAPGKNAKDKVKHYAAHLETTFTKAYPTATVAARLHKDTKITIPHKEKVAKFLQNNEDFNLLHDHVGTFLKDNKDAVAQKDEADVATHVRRIQRVLKLTPSFDNASVLLNDGIHSAQQIHKMGQDNFVKAYGETFGEAQATQIFQQASATHASALALTANLKSLADASAMNAFPNFGAAIAEQLAADLPNLDTLFLHTDFCECDECNSVYGASAYLTDILHYLANRPSTLPPPVTGASRPMVKDILLRRRPDLGNIDLNCDNTNTLVPYIDIACELMEDYISPPVITLTGAQTPSLAAGLISTAALTTLKTQLTAAGMANVAGLLTAAATISQDYQTQLLQDDNTWGFTTNSIIRDARIALKATSVSGIANSTTEIRVLHQTFEDSDTINAGPEYVNTYVYSNFLATAKAPFSLPFDLFETEGELYLQQLGISKADLIDIFRKEDHTAPGNSVSDIKMGYAKLGINLAEQALIFTADPTHQSLYWGGAAANITTAAQIDIFQGLTNLTYEQILSLIKLQFINPAKDIVIEHDNLLPNVKTQRLINLNGTKLDAMHRFLRLWRKTSFSMEELDAIIMAPKMGNGAIPTKLSYLICKLSDLQQKLRLSVFEILAFYQNIDTTHNQPNCLYNQLFQNASITNPVSANFSIAVATVGTTGIVEADKPVLAAILQIPGSDVNLLLAKTNSKISLANFSLLFRYTKLAQGLGLSITDLLTLINLIDANPFLDPVSTALFLNKYNLLKSSGFSIDELNYILRHQDNATHTLVPSAGQITAALTQVQAEFLAINAATQPEADPNGQLLTKWLSDGVFNWDRASVNRLVDILNTVDDTVYLQKLMDNLGFLNNLRVVYHDARITADLPALPLDSAGKQVVIPAAITPQLSYNAETKQLVFTGYMHTSVKDALLALVAGSTTDPNVALFTAAVNTIFIKAQQTDSSAANLVFSETNTIDTVLVPKAGGNTAARFAYFINLVSPVYIKLQQQNALIKDIANWFTIDKNVATQLLASLPGIYADFSTTNFISKSVPLTNAVQVNRYLLLAKMCLIISKLKLTAEELAFQVARAVDITSLDITALPVAPVTAAATTFPAFEAFINLLRFDQNYPAVVTNIATGATLSIYSILTDAVAQKKAGITGAALTTWTATLVANLALLTGWNQADLGTLIGAGGNIATLALPQDIYSVPILTRLNTRITMQQQLGISITDAFGWTKDALSVADTAKIKQVVKSKYVNADWVQVSKKAQDTLREKKRDALIAYLLANPGTQTWKDADDLYAFFLMDVEMCSCQPTSRIVQATNSVQLFVQRCFLQLEPNVLVDTTVDSVWEQWQWMKNFRVWQANLKTFLWPENYIEPELLPVGVKSSFFSELESELLQGDVTAQKVEDAFQNYLLKLSDIANLHVKGVWYDEPSKEYHVIAHTSGDPKVYYHRTLIESQRWTPWVKIDVDIDSAYLFPLVYRKRLFLFGATIDKKTKPGSTSNEMQWVIQLTYSEFSGGKWKAKKTTRNDNTGQIVADINKYPDITKFFFSVLDLPNWDFASGRVGNNVHQVGDELWVATAENGQMLIACSYFKTPFTGVASWGSGDYIGGFILNTDVTPTVFNSPMLFVVEGDGTTNADGNDNRNFVNMVDVELNPPVAPTVSGFSLPNARGGFSKIFPFQLDRIERRAVPFRIGGDIFAGAEHPLMFLTYNFPWFHQDSKHTYFVRPEYIQDNGSELFYDDRVKFNQTIPDGVSDPGFESFNENRLQFRYFNHYHPHISYFIQKLFINGIDGLLSRTTQLKGDPDPLNDTSTDKFDFATYYADLIPGTKPSGGTIAIYNIHPIYKGANNSALPIEDVDFSLQSGYGLYNWELFYHAPLMIAERLSQNQQFDDADRWYKYIFNPFDTSNKPSPSKYWNTKPFFKTTSDDYLKQRIDQVLRFAYSENTLTGNIADWRRNPFQPHFVAQHRTVAYQKVAVMKYIGHLIRYGDYLFTQDTMESVNQATQLYILAAEILGPKPQVIPSPVVKPVDNYNQLGDALDVMSNTTVDIENLLPFQTVVGFTPDQLIPSLNTQYFCLPMNENLTGSTGYWDVVSDRLFKIRHCMNIGGTLAPLVLFAPVINPALLVRATAAGLDIGSILNDLNAPLPYYRFSVMLQKAVEYTNDVKALGSLLLAALEKRDIEALTLLRATQEAKVLTAAMQIKKKNIQEALTEIDSLNVLLSQAIAKQTYYKELIDNGWSNWEKGSIAGHSASAAITTIIAATSLLSAFGHGSPDVAVGVGPGGLQGTPLPTAEEIHGGSHVGHAASNVADNIRALADGIDKGSAIAATVAGYNRRADEWKFQFDQAERDIKHIKSLIASAEIKRDITISDSDLQQLQIDNAAEMNEAMRSKFTSQELYNWMITQISTTYFKSYQLAYIVAKKAEHCYRYELGLDNSSFINFGYWDSLKKGLMSGELLYADIKAMDAAYLDQNKREQELTKSISISQLDPVALHKLKTTGECWINLPEELFDMDYPGHYMRRIKSVSLTIPCIAGPYTTVSAKLTMTNNSMRVSPLAASDPAQYSRKMTTSASPVPTDDPRFRDSVGALQSISTSSAQNDSGLFELNFRDERYLPFEGAGAISLWHLELPSFLTVKQFDFDTISDVIIHLKYTARDTGEPLKTNAVTSLQTKINQMLVSTRDTGLMRIFSAKNDLSNEWYRFLNPVNEGDDQVLTLNLDKTRFPLFAQNRDIKIKSIELIADSSVVPINGLVVTPAPIAPAAVNLTRTNIYGANLSVTLSYNNDPGMWVITNPKTKPRLTADTLKNLVVIVHYTVA